MVVSTLFGVYHNVWPGAHFFNLLFTCKKMFTNKIKPFCTPQHGFLSLCKVSSSNLINPRRVLYFVCLSVSQCVCLRLFSHCRERSGIRAIPTAPAQQAIENKMEILLKRRRSRSRNWHYRGPRCVTQPIN